MKRILALVLSFVMLLTLFAGLSVNATNTEDGSVMVLTTGDAIIYGESYKSTYHAWAVPESEYDVTFTQTANIAGIGYEGGVVMDCEVPTGQQPCVRFYTIGIYPNVTVNSDNNLFGMYLKLPTYVVDALPSNRRWNELMRFKYMTVKQGDKTFTASIDAGSFSGMSFKKLAADGSAWQNDTLSGNNFGTSVSGFEGYVFLDLSTMPVFEEWEFNGFDPNADYTVVGLEFYNSCVGGVCGEFSIGGWYGVDVNSTSTVAQIKGAPVSLNLSSFDANPLVGKSTKSFGLPGNSLNAGGYVWNVGFQASDLYPEKFDTDVKTISGLTNCINKDNAIEFYAETASGYLTDQPVQFYANIGTSPSDGVKTGMLYVELPETGLGYNSIKIDTVVYDGYAAWQNFANTEFQYLPINGSAWVTSTVTSNKEFILPDGFKGYVKLPFNNDTYTVWKFEFLIGMYGGEYGSAYLGGIFDLSVDNNSIYMSLGGAQAVRLTDGSAVSPIQGTMNNVAYNGDSFVLGAAPNHFSISTNPNNAVTAKWIENCEEIGTHMMRAAVSDTAVNNVKVTATPWAKVSPDTNTVMVYMELPTAPDGAAWQVKLGDLAFTQGRYYWSNFNGMQYTYLASDSTKWVNGVIASDGNGILKLPNGFKGYVKLDFSTCVGYRGVWDDPSSSLYGSDPFEYDAEYTLANISFTFNYFGGEYGNFVLGPWTTVNYDSTSLYANISNSDTAVDGEAESLSIYANINGVNLNKVIANLEEIGDVTVADAALVEETITLYESLPVGYISKLTEEQQAAYEAIVKAFDVYRPGFKGVSILVPTGADEAGLRVGVTVDGSAAAEEGYYVTEYGTVRVTELNPLNIKFGMDEASADVDRIKNSDTTKTAFEMDSYYKAQSWDDYTKRLYFRSYVVYSNGTKSYTVYNGNYDNTYRVSSEQYEAPNLEEVGKHYAINITTSDPYLYTGITLAANAFGVPVLDGYAYGNLNGDCNIVSGNLLEENIDAADLIIARKYLLGKEKLSNWYVADVDGNGAVNIKDVVRLKKYLAGEDIVLGEKKFNLPEFLTGKDMYGDKSVNIIGDSISQGFNAPRLYDQSWASLFKNSLNKENGTYNLGFVSLHDFDDWGVEDCSEIHKVEVTKSGWVNKSVANSGKTPGCYSYTAGANTEGATLQISVDRMEGGANRHINGFYLYYVEAPDYGSFDVLVNGEKLTTINCNSATANYCARSPYIALPEDCGNDVIIEIVKLTNGVEPVTIAGIGYIDDPDAVTVNNYSLGGLQLLDMDDSLLRNLAKANVVIFTMGTNDAGLKNDIAKFKKKLDVVVEACKENGSILIVGDVIWARYGNEYWATDYKNALREMARNADGYVVDFTELPINSVLDLTTDKADICHPTVAGHKLMAEKLCRFFGLKLDTTPTLALDYDEGMDMFGEQSINIIGDSISQGIGTAKMYDNSWASLFKGAVNEYWGSNNLGYVSFNDGYADDFSTDSNYKEIHKLTVNSTEWEKKSGYETPTPGSYSYISKNADTDSVITIELNRKEGGIDRNINGFYIYHSVGAAYGSYKVTVNGTAVAAVDCAATADSHYARSEYIALPEGCGDELTIKIIKSADTTGTVRINGISYIDNPDAPTVNNYALSGVRLCEFEDELLRQLSKANTVILTLGTNDVNTDGVYDWGSNITLFKQKLDVIVNACKENGSTLVVGDVIWNLDNKAVATDYKQALRDAAEATGGYVIDFTTLDMSSGMADRLHPNASGYRLMADMICDAFGLQLS